MKNIIREFSEIIILLTITFYLWFVILIILLPIYTKNIENKDDLKEQDVEMILVYQKENKTLRIGK